MTRVTLVLCILLAAMSGSAVAAKERAKNAASPQTNSSGQSEEVRDWSKIDTDRDGYVEPAEMEKFLQAVWAQRGKSTAAQDKRDKNN